MHEDVNCHDEKTLRGDGDVGDVDVDVDVDGNGDGLKVNFRAWY